ncbi:unnamed protein product [Clavelina lepadiformis]|uniref:Fibrinogen C-terminal domain-containing protein n=1 Tax=Clavelina lepadiformis TaxID=159417 RepID=A0ABP0GS26_CLALP
MKLTFCLVLIAFSHWIVSAQQCRQICDEDLIQWLQSSINEANGDEIMAKLTRLEKLLNATTTTNTHACSPPSCDTSLTDGVQLLQSGDEVYCEDGWTVFQRRVDGSVSFERDWNEYRSGFGEINGDFWLGLGKVHRLTQSGRCRLRVELWSFDNDYGYADYIRFSIDDEENLFRLRIGAYNGTAGNALGYHRNQALSSRDQDNDSSVGHDCANYLGGDGGWWYRQCLSSNLNGRWGSESVFGRITWNKWLDSKPIKSTEMKFRCDGNWKLKNVA